MLVDVAGIVEKQDMMLGLIIACLISSFLILNVRFLQGSYIEDCNVPLG